MSSTIVALLSKDFLKLVLIAAIIAFPVAWYAMHKWLQDFAYRINIQWWVFVVAGFAALINCIGNGKFPGNKSSIGKPGKEFEK